ncbi:hypothetical protein TNCV_580011 [Trichonephila clavipes]|nr:hypothetical protein TNCV_580011 [Trichonephila clavipes]
MEDDSFRQESPVNTSKENQSFFFPEFDLNKFSSCKSFLDCFDQQCLEYQKDEQWKKQNIPRYLTGVYLKFCTPQPSHSTRSQSPSDTQEAASTTANNLNNNTRQRNQGQKESPFAKREGNIFRINNQSDDDENNTWNGNSTQQM